MDRRRWRKAALAVVLSAGALVFLYWFLLNSFFTTSDSVAVPRLDNVPFNGIMRVLVEDKGSGTPFFKGDEEWMVHVVEVTYDRGPYASVAAGGGTVSQPLPDPGDQVRLSVPGHLTLETGREYYVLVARARFDDPEEQAKWPWQASLVLDLSGSPVPGTEPELVADLKAITLPGETGLDALRAFAAEQARTLDARVTQGVENPGERLALLRPTESVASTGDPVADFMARAPEDRQLPGMLVDVPEGLDAALGIDEWASWRVIVQYDEATAGDYQWIGVLIDGVGFIGPTELPADQTLTEIDGIGPPEGTVGSLLFWRHGTPAEIPPPGASVPDAVGALQVGVAPVEVTEQVRNTLDQGGAVVVDLRDGQIDIDVLTRDEARNLVVSAIPPASPASELSEGS